MSKKDKNMRIITCASYYGTGSSAVTDFFSEFDDICSLGDYEYRFLQEPDGISDLEYNLIENNHRHNTSDSIKRFLKYLSSLKKMGYGGYDIFGDQFEILTNKYIDEIVQLKTHTWWNKDRTDKGQLFCFIDRIYSLAKRLFTGNLHSERKFSLLQNREWGYYTAISEDDFLKATRKLVNDLMASVNIQNLPFVMVDQMVPPTNTNRYIRYFDDVKIIVVDRDPRDVYLLEKVFWQWGVIPVNDVREFVTWFKITREYGREIKEDTQKVLRIQFENLVYDYEQTRKELTEFVGIGLDKHTSPLNCFNPKISIKNTNLKNKVKGYEKDIAYIERNLEKYLYPFKEE